MQATGGWWVMYCGQLKCLFLHVFNTHLKWFSSSFFILPLKYLMTALSAILLLAPSDTSETAHPVLLLTWQKCDTDLKTIPKLIWPLATPLQQCLKNEDSFVLQNGLTKGFSSLGCNTKRDPWVKLNDLLLHIFSFFLWVTLWMVKSRCRGSPKQRTAVDSILNLRIFNLIKWSIFLEILITVFCNGHFINIGDNSSWVKWLDLNSLVGPVFSYNKVFDAFCNHLHVVREWAED